MRIYFLRYGQTITIRILRSFASGKLAAIVCRLCPICQDDGRGWDEAQDRTGQRNSATNRFASDTAAAATDILPYLCLLATLPRIVLCTFDIITDSVLVLHLYLYLFLCSPQPSTPIYSNYREMN